ncbi:MAG: DUF72 domain-containing protein [Usitatibacter sp.]
MIRVGTAGWSLPPADSAAFPAGGSHLERYAAVFDAVEINSSFQRRHRAATYARWARSVPAAFRFAVKVPKSITHERKLVRCPGLLDDFLEPVLALEGKLGCLLVQLPPKLEFDAALAGRFLRALRTRYEGAVALEARHASWFERRAGELLEKHRVARVAADPPRAPGDGTPGGWRGLAYYRLHGSPRMYYSAYPEEWLDALARRIPGGEARETWCIFDNTAARAAVGNALRLREKLKGPGPGHSSSHQPGRRP